MRPKFGFKTFVQAKSPIVHPKLPFDKSTDLKETTSGLWCYILFNGLVSRKPKQRTTTVIFEYYLESGRVHVYLPEFLRYTTISIESLHTKDEERPVSEAA